MKCTNVFIVLFLFAFMACNNKQKIEMKDNNMDLPINDKKEILVKSFEIDPYCDTAYPRLSLAEMRWQSPSKKINNQRIDITTFKNGFSKNLFFTMIPESIKSNFFMPKDQEPAIHLENSIKNIKLIDLNYSEDNIVSLKFSEFVPGVNYYVRVSQFNEDSEVWIPSQIINFQAAICPADMINK